MKHTDKVRSRDFLGISEQMKPASQCIGGETSPIDWNLLLLIVRKSELDHILTPAHVYHEPRR